MSNGKPNDSLEDRLSSTGTEEIQTTSTTDSSSTLPYRPWREYLVNASATSLFFTPLFGVIEYFSGMETKQILYSRAIATGIHFTIAKPYAAFRQKVASWMGADYSSSQLRKYAVDTAAMIVISLPVYSTQLYFAGAPLKAMAVALPSALLTWSVIGRPFGRWQDWWRKQWGVKPTLDK